MPEQKILESILKGSMGIVHAEDVLVEAVRDLVKDEIKRYIRDKLEANPQIKAELKEGIGDLMEAKMKEAYALVKIAKSGAKLGLELVPSHLRKEMTKDLVQIFEKEIDAIMEKTL